MLTSLDFLNPGQVWPPTGETDRLSLYEKNQLLFAGEHVRVYAEQFKRIQRVIGNFEDVISYTFVANYQKLLSLKVADLLLGETPKITTGDPDSAEQKRLEEIIELSDLHNTAYEGAIDVSRYGDGILQVYEDQRKGVIGIASPATWFPVVDGGNIRKVLYHVLAWTEEAEKAEYLNIRIHSRGEIETRKHLLKGGKIAEPVMEPKSTKTGLSDFAIIPVHNLITSERVTGFDDYSDVDAIISELLVRVAQVARVLDKFSDPAIEGPASALTQDPKTGEWKLFFGNFFKRDSAEDPEVKPIVWDASMDANFKMIERLVNILHEISEVGSLIFTDQLAKTGDITGPGMKRVHMAALAKVNRIKMRFDPALRKAIALASEVGSGVRLKPSQVSIWWNDGLPDDEQENAQAISTLYGAGLISLETALRRLGFEGQELQDELKRIQGEQQAQREQVATITPRIQLPAAAGGEV